MQRPMLSRLRATRFATPNALTFAVLACILVVMATATVAAMRTTSTTFDEIAFIAGGARGYETGTFDLAADHPPLMQYIYGLPAALAGASLPDESSVTPEARQHPGYHYGYAAEFFWGVGNDPERMAFLGRLPAVMMALGLVLATFFFTRSHWGPYTALLAAALVAFLPDVLAHGGVAYSDVPVTLALFGAAWSLDEAVRKPSWRRGILVGLLAGLGLAVKISAAALVPLAAALIVFELIARSRARGVDGRADSRARWGRDVAVAALAAALAAYAVLVLVYRGDVLLEQFRYGFAFRFRHMSTGHGAPGYLLGETSVTGWWYFFPVAFLFKTSAGLHVLLAISLIALVVTVRAHTHRVLSSPLRVAVLGVTIFGSILLSSNLNIGFRYALPVLPWICVITAVGVRLAWRTAMSMVRAVIVLATVVAVAFPLSYFPNFLSFISEYGPARDENHTVLVDSSLDWGQGLLALRDYMRDNGIPSIYLSYFGSARPDGYGIEYVPLPSFFPLAPRAAPSVTPQWVAISATNLQGVYLDGDPLSMFRDTRPDTVLAHSILLFRIESPEAAR